MTGYPNAEVVGAGDLARRGLSGTQAGAVDAERGRREAAALRRRLLRKRLAGGDINEADIAERDALAGANVDRARLERARERDALRTIDPEGQFQEANSARLRALARVVREEGEVANALGPAPVAVRQSPEEAAAAYRLSRQSPAQAGLSRLLPGAATREVYAAAEAEETAARGGAPVGVDGDALVRNRLAYLRGQRERLGAAPGVRPSFASDEARAAFEAETPGALRQTVAGTLDARRRLLGETASRAAETERGIEASRAGEVQEAGRQAQLRLARSLGADQATVDDPAVEFQRRRDRDTIGRDEAARAIGLAGVEELQSVEDSVVAKFEKMHGSSAASVFDFDPQRFASGVDTLLSLGEPERTNAARRIIQALRQAGITSAEAYTPSRGSLGTVDERSRVVMEQYRRLQEAAGI